MGLQRKGFHWGKITGKLSCTPEQALRDFGFGMKPDAQGIIFREYTYTNAEGKRVKGTFINNYFPPSNPQTVTQQANRRRFAILSHIAVEHPDLIYKVWQPLSKKRDPKKAHGFNEFRAENMRLIDTPPDFSKMRVTDGSLEPTPQIIEIGWMTGVPTLIIKFDPSTTRNGDPKDRVYSAIYIKSTETLELIPPAEDWKREDEWSIGNATEQHPLTDIIGYVWFRRNITYSPSMSIIGG